MNTTYTIHNDDGTVYSRTNSPETAEAASRNGLRVTAETGAA